MRRLSTFASSIPAVILALAAAACSTRDAPRGDGTRSSRALQISGELLPNGSCRVRVGVGVDGVEVFAPGDSARTVVVAGRTVNMAPPGHDLHELWCVPASVAEPMIPESASERALLITLYPRAGAAPSVGRYAIARDVPSSGGAAAEGRAGLSLFDPTRTGAGGASDRGGIAYLAGDSGTVTLTRVDSARVVGTFTVRATRAWTM